VSYLHKRLNGTKIGESKEEVKELID